MGAQDSQHEAAADRLAWVRQMRGAFSPPNMCQADGEVAQEFFRPKNIVIRLTEQEMWGAAQKEALYKVNGCTNRTILLLLP